MVFFSAGVASASSLGCSAEALASGVEVDALELLSGVFAIFDSAVVVRVGDVVFDAVFAYSD